MTRRTKGFRFDVRDLDKILTNEGPTDSFADDPNHCRR